MRQIIKIVLVTLLVLNPVWADDVEIFFSTNDSPETQPNVLFILDGSGSMNIYDCADGSEVWYASCQDGSPNGTTSRLTRMIDSLTGIIETTTDVNIGLMRFSHNTNGGRIIYPARDVDLQLCDGVPCERTTYPTQTSIEASAGDAYEDNNGEVFLDEVALPLMTYDGTSTAIFTGLHFPELLVPQGATVIDARIEFTSASNASAYSELNFAIENNVNSVPFEDGFNKIRDRNWAPNTVNWKDVPPWTLEEVVESPNLATLINPIVSKSDWCGGKPVSFSIEGIGDRLASAYERGNQTVPVLKLNYHLDNLPATGGCMLGTAQGLIQSSAADARESRRTNGNIGETGTTNSYLRVRNNWTSGLSFTGVDVPQGAKITSAKVTLHMQDNTSQNTGDTVTNIYLEDNGNPATFSPVPFNITSRQWTQAAVWDDPFTNVEAILPGSRLHITPDISHLVEAVVNRPDWAPNNRMNVFFEYASGNSRRSYETFDRGRDLFHSLDIEYERQVTPDLDPAQSGLVTGVRSDLVQILNEFQAEGSTPAVGALIEAQRYFAGDPVGYGKARIPTLPHENNPRFSRVSHPQSYTGGSVDIPNGCGNDQNAHACEAERINGSPQYTSPITHECQQNHVVLLTDGIPDWNPVSAPEAKSIIGGDCQLKILGDLGYCGPEFAAHMNNYDLDSALEGTQNLTVHTIGFNLLDNTWLKAVSSAGGGSHSTADSASELTTAITSILTSVAPVNTTFVAPGATVDHFSRLAHREDIYLALFQPDKTPGWNGNLKKYTIKGLPPAIFDVNNAEAVNTAEGVFRDEARSFWSTETDGNNLLLGGAASLLDPADRKLVSYFGGSNTDLFSASNEISLNNSSVTQGLFNADSEAELAQMMDWLYGIDVLDQDRDGDTTDLRHHFGDPLHSQPQLITYGGTQTDPDSMVVFGTNDGFIHGINAKDGKEQFAFMPNTLFDNLKRLYNNNQIASDDARVYGMDGDLTVWIKEENKNGIVDTNDAVYLYAGMRRGGRDYWVLDLTDRDNPAFKARIQGGVGNFAELGETWSKPTLARINIGGSIRQVLIFAGGYDNSQDEKTTRIADNVGRAVYIVDAENPTDILWSGSGHPFATLYPNTERFTEMNYSIPSDVLVINDGENNLASQIYVGDMGGQVWRFDVNNGAGEGPDLVSGGVIADLSEDKDESAARKFYFPPDLSLSIVDNQQFLNIGIGSGFEAHPLDSVIEDNFYMIRYPYQASGNYGTTDPSTAPDNFRSIKMDDLFDATDNIIGQGTDVQIEDAREELNNSHGWFIDLPRPGEKILGASTTLDNVTRYISYVPSQGEVGCLPDIGRSYYWSVNLDDGTPQRREFEGRLNLTAEDRSTIIASPGKAPPVQVLFTTGKDDNGRPVITPTDVSGINVLSEGNSTEQTKRWYWSEYPE